MAVNFLDNINYGGKKPNFSRDQFKTIDAMNSYDPAYLDEGHISYCIEDGKHYSFDGNMWKLFAGSGSAVETIEWDHTSNANTFIEAGTYKIKGERTGNMLTDNLPIMNSGSGHTIDGILVVLDSSLTNGSGKVDDCIITQLLILSNRAGGPEGDMYMRSAYGTTKDSLTWKPWEKYQTNMEVGAVNNEYFLLSPESPTMKIGEGGMNSLTANGIYSGIYYPPAALIGTPSIDASLADTTAIETFTMVVINNSIVAKENSSLVQIKFSITMGGVFSAEKRIAKWNADPNAPNGGTWSFSNSVWESISGSGELTNPNFHFNSDGTKLILGSGAWGDKQSRIGKNASIGDNVYLPSDLSFSTSAEGLCIKVGEDTWTISNIG